MPFAAPPSPALTLLIPGLLWPEPALSDTVFDLHLPALQTLLGRSRITRQPLDEAGWWHQWTGAPLAPAPYRLLALGALGALGAPANDYWLCADLVHLRFEQQALVLEDPATLSLSGEESHSLAADIAPLLTAFGTLHITSSRHWHLQPHDTAPSGPALLAELIGQPARKLLPEGTEHRPWRRLLNEIQMVLHQHPVNRAREAAGQPVINNLSFWGGGSLPTTTPSTSFSRLLSDEIFHHGLALHRGMETDALPADYVPSQGHTLAVCARLANPTLLRNAMDWREGLHQLETHWFAPILAALNDSRLKHFSLVGLGNQEDTATCLTATTTGMDRFKPWRRPRPLTELHP